MIHAVITYEKEMLSELRKSFELQKTGDESGFEIFKNEGLVVVFPKDQREAVERSVQFTIENFHPDFLFFISFSKSFATEQKAWDVILPNVFFPYNDAVEHTEITAENRDSFMGTPLFLEQYETQNDYDLENFGLSVGWIHLGWQVSPDADLQNLQMVYGADSYDEHLYQFVQSAHEKNIKDVIYPISVIRESHGITIPSETAGINAHIILRFLMDTFQENSGNSMQTLHIQL